MGADPNDIVSLGKSPNHETVGEDVSQLDDVILEPETTTEKIDVKTNRPKRRKKKKEEETQWKGGGK